MTTQERMWAGSVFMRVLADQSLLHDSKRRNVDERWPSEAVRQRVWADHGYWMAHLAPTVIEVLLDECVRPSYRVVLSSLSEYESFLRTIASRAETRASFFEEPYVRRAVDAVVGALCSSPELSEPFEFMRRGVRYRFTRNRDTASFERVR